MKKLLFTAVALIAFSGFAVANNKSKTVSTSDNLQLVKEENAKSKTLEEKDVWFCYLASSTTSAPDMAGNTTTVEIYNCTWHDLSTASITAG